MFKDIKAVIFDLDGVITRTSKFHHVGWKAVSLMEDIALNDEEIQALDGIGRLESLEIILKNKYTQDYIDKYLKHNGIFQQLADKKNLIYLKCLASLTSKDILPGVEELIQKLKNKKIKVAVASSSKNTFLILEKLGLNKTFDAVTTGLDISKSKPDPEIFLLAAERLNVKPQDCLVIEDAASGIQAAKSAGMKTIGVVEGLDADYNFTNLEDIGDI